MNKTKQSNSEKARVQALREYALLGTLPESLYDAVAQRAATLCDAPIALLTLVDERRQWFKARVGFSLPELPRSIGFDAQAILQTEPLIIRDTLADSRFSQNPLVMSEMNIRFYAGAPLITEEGYAIGALSVMDYTARDLTAVQIEGLQGLARQAMTYMEQRRRQKPSALALAGDPHDAKVYSETPSEFQLELLPDVIMRFGPDLRYRYVSPLANETLGVNPDSLLGRIVGEERSTVPFAPLLRPALERVLRNRRIEQIEFDYASPFGRRVLQTRLTPEWSGGGDVGYSLCYKGRDPTGGPVAY